MGVEELEEFEEFDRFGKLHGGQRLGKMARNKEAKLLWLWQ